MRLFFLNIPYSVDYGTQGYTDIQNFEIVAEDIESAQAAAVEHLINEVDPGWDTDVIVDLDVNDGWVFDGVHFSTEDIEEELAVIELALQLQEQAVNPLFYLFLASV